MDKERKKLQILVLFNRHFQGIIDDAKNNRSDSQIEFVEEIVKLFENENQNLLHALQVLKNWVGKLHDWEGPDPPTEIVERAIKDALK